MAVVADDVNVEGSLRHSNAVLVPGFILLAVLDHTFFLNDNALLLQAPTSIIIFLL